MRPTRLTHKKGRKRFGGPNVSNFYKFLKKRWMSHNGVLRQKRGNTVLNQSLLFSSSWGVRLRRKKNYSLTPKMVFFSKKLVFSIQTTHFFRNEKNIVVGYDQNMCLFFCAGGGGQKKVICPFGQKKNMMPFVTPPLVSFQQKNIVVGGWRNLVGTIVAVFGDQRPGCAKDTNICIGANK